MTNKEKAELYRIASMCETCKARIGLIGFDCDLEEDACKQGKQNNLKWLMQDYEEKQEEQPPVDWSKVPVDTLIEVSVDGINWVKRYFAEYDKSIVCAWDNGSTSITAEDEWCISEWKYARLVEEE